MLNISPNSIHQKMQLERFNSFGKTGLSKANRMFTNWLLGSLGLFILILLLPWTQNIQSDGKVTTLRPEQRPQTIHTTIAGRIEKWYVREGDFVEKGDTIVYLSEIKSEYFDPDLVSRAGQQVSAKEGAIEAYSRKIRALDNQIEAFKRELELKSAQLKNKIEQAQLKITSDSIELERARLDLQIAERQLNRAQTLYEEGIKSLTEVEDKRLKKQETSAKVVAVENKLLTSRNQLTNAQLALSTIRYSYNQKIAKAESEKFSTLSNLYDAEAGVNKLRTAASNYQRRSDFYYITAPQDCYINLALTPGIGETVKEGAPVVSIMPSDYELAVELFVRPMDLPLIELGQEVRFIFDGWPAFIFSGWPGQSFGTYRGNVTAIENNISPNGKYRILVAPNEQEKPWPEALRAGSGAQGIALLNDVPLWYEIWRRLNGFPPDYYNKNQTKEPKLKAPIKSIK